MKNVLILHGAGNNSQGNWFLWLKGKLIGIGYKVWLPDLPDFGEPQTDRSLDFIFSNKKWDFNEESILVGHSSGSTLILRILEKLPKDARVKRVVLVATPVEVGTKPEYFKYKQGLLEKPFDWEKIKSSCGEFYFIHSDNDHYECGEDQGKLLQEHVGGELIVQLGEGHFNLEVGEQYKKFPLVFDLVTKDNKNML